jgi:hypothetical protein
MFCISICYEYMLYHFHHIVFPLQGIFISQILIYIYLLYLFRFIFLFISVLSCTYICTFLFLNLLYFDVFDVKVINTLIMFIFNIDLKKLILYFFKLWFLFVLNGYRDGVSATSNVLIFENCNNEGLRKAEAIIMRWRHGLT